MPRTSVRTIEQAADVPPRVGRTCGELAGWWPQDSGRTRRVGHFRQDTPLPPPLVGAYRGGMCRNITVLRGLEPAANETEVEAAARQYVRKVSGITHPTERTRDAFERAVAEVAHITEHLLAELPERRQPPKTVPPLRRPEVLERIAAREAAGAR